jgi:hypothetical protein
LHARDLMVHETRHQRRLTFSRQVHVGVLAAVLVWRELCVVLVVCECVVVSELASCSAAVQQQ